MAGRGIGSEFDLIARYFAPLAAGVPGALGLADDAAIVDLAPGQRLVATADALVAGIHFLPDDPPEDIARKMIRVNLSDLAAMGAQPVGLLFTAVFPGDVKEAWLEQFAAGLKADIEAYRAPLIGGDTVSGEGALTLSLTALGTVPGETVLTRRGAEPGDDIFVTGTIGDGALGLEVARGGLTSLDEAFRRALLGRYRRPEPRIGFGARLLDHAHASIDVSDGLIADLGHVCASSGVGARITAAAIPLSEAARAVVDGDRERLAALLGGGDDYELLFTAPAGSGGAITGIGTELGVAVARIGCITEGSGVEVEDAEALGLTFHSRGYRHFAGHGKGRA